jgi:hypothetical protein
MRSVLFSSTEGEQQKTAMGLAEFGDFRPGNIFEARHGG